MKKLLASFAVMLSLGVAIPAHANTKCFQAPESDTVFQGETGFDKQGEREKAYAKAENPAMELMFCAASLPVAGMDILKQNCQCVPRIKELCSFKYKDGKIRYRVGQGVDLAWCLAFPLTMWSKH